MLDGAVIAEYAEAMEDGKQFPPVTVFYDGSSYWLADGFHRVNAALQVGRGYVEAQIITGTQRDAVLYSVGANAAHGLRRSNADKRRAVERLLRDDEWAKWSDSEIARRRTGQHATELLTSIEVVQVKQLRAAGDDIRDRQADPVHFVDDNVNPPWSGLVDLAHCRFTLRERAAPYLRRLAAVPVMHRTEIINQVTTIESIQKR